MTPSEPPAKLDDPLADLVVDVALAERQARGEVMSITVARNP